MDKVLTAPSETFITPRSFESFHSTGHIKYLQNQSFPLSPAGKPTELGAFTDLYIEYKTAVEATLQKVLQQVEPKNLLEPMSYILSNGGKRIRPILTMLACGAVGGNPYYAVMGGIVIEVLHNFTLVHDDIMDEAPLRRGLPTIHAKWNRSIAILSGDALMAFAYQLLFKNYAIAPRFTDCIDLVTRAVLKICEGQVLDIEFQSRSNVTMADYFSMIAKKTAHMLELSASLGTVLGNGFAHELAALRTYSCSLGIAFQIIDDMLDVTPSPEFGKTRGGDILEGKKTFPIVYALENRHTMNISDIALLKEYVENRGLPRERVNEMVLLFERNGIFEEAGKAIALYTERAHKALNSLPDTKYRTMLHQLSEVLLTRCW
jgi:geranylgeranyl diphosphate synthase, type II